MAEGSPQALAQLIQGVRAALVRQRELGLQHVAARAELSPPARPTPGDAASAAPLRSTAKQSRLAASTPGPSAAAVAPEAAGEAVATGASAPAKDAAARLAAIQKELGPCTRCKLCERRTQIVFGVGDPNARLVFVGEAPGRDEDLQGEPFVGAAGKLLDRMIAAMGLRRRDVYIANIVKCRPPKNRDPEPDEVAQCEPFLRQQIAAIEPEAIVGLGRYAVQTLLRDSTAITKQRGQWRQYDGIPFMPTFHPAYLLRNPAEKRGAWNDLQMVMAKLGLEDPRRK